MPFYVLGQVIRPHKPPLAYTAFKLLLSGMGALVPRELIRTGKPATALLPIAHERPFSRVRPVVRLQMRRFEIVLPAALVGAFKHASSGGRRRRCGGEQKNLSGNQRAAVSGEQQRLRRLQDLGSDRS